MQFISLKLLSLYISNMCKKFYLKSPIIRWHNCIKVLRINVRASGAMPTWDRCQGIPVVHHELLHGQQSIVADLLVFMVHVVHHQLLSTKLLNNPVKQKRLWRCHFFQTYAGHKWKVQIPKAQRLSKTKGIANCRELALDLTSLSMSYRLCWLNEDSQYRFMDRQLIKLFGKD